MEKFFYSLGKISQSKKTTIFWLFVIIPVFNYISLNHSLDLTLWADDYLAFIINKYEYGDKFSLSNYFHPYGGGFLIMFFLESVVGWESYYYFLVSMILKIFASISIYFMVLEVSRLSLAALIASLIFSTGYIGLETTNWVFNMNTYVGLIFINMFIYTFFRSKRESRLGLYFIGLIFFTMSLFMATTRMHGFLVFFIMELIWLFRKPDRKNITFFVSRILGLVASVSLIKAAGSFYLMSDRINRFKQGIDQAVASYSQGNFDFIIYPFTSLGNIILPDIIMNFVWKYINNSFYWENIYKRGFLLTIVLILFVMAFGLNLFAKLREKACVTVIIWSTIWTVLLIYISQLENTTLNNFHYLCATLIGGFIVFLSIWLYFRYKKTEKEFTDVIIFFMGFIIFSCMTPIIFDPNMVIVSCHRYLTVPFAGFAAFVGCIIAFAIHNIKSSSYENDSLFRRILRNMGLFSLLCILIGIIISNITASNQYLKQHAEYRGKRTETWKTLVTNLPKIEDISIFYITHDNVPYDKYHGLISSGFQPQAALIYNIKEQAKWPYITDDFDTVVKILKKGELSQYGRHPQPVDLNNVFSFDLREGDQLVNTRKEVIQQLKERLQTEILEINK